MQLNAAVQLPPLRVHQQLGTRQPYANLNGSRVHAFMIDQMVSQLLTYILYDTGLG